MKFLSIATILVTGMFADSLTGLLAVTTELRFLHAFVIGLLFVGFWSVQVVRDARTLRAFKER
jgi:hypothetical protein